ncbi:threonine-phosphate decarboxylase CobD [Marinobacter confluentis]|uniref:threonine-phosphate decarboxylase n=1 Tax=Marinobacter confluentis TaxID=1697557 RepID=A0A4Z1CGF2_9GAMM|nr:threonine-phosphate decarboxylase CobD [Marinobacter confluentis]TGN39314.1 threonine-phosphate decarboxylase [Marinobacter confluentis]
MVARPHHGGRLNNAAKRWDIPFDQWLDLSTGINPLGWPVPEVPVSVWQRLPDPDDGLANLLGAWVGAPEDAACVPVSGSQSAIMALPGLRAPGCVGVPVPGYQEHGHWWKRLGHRVLGIPPEQMLDDDEGWLDELDVLVCINPNNPTGDLIPVERLLTWHRNLSRRGGWLIVDEAFIEGSDGQSMARFAGQTGLIVMRSLGKFFGLAGLRAGAVITSAPMAGLLDDALGAWHLNGPARYLMAKALADQRWQTEARQRLARDSQRLHHLLLHAGLPDSTGTLLFRYLPQLSLEQVHALADGLASRGILVRVFDQPPALRFGLPGSESDWQKLEQALADLTKHIDRSVTG